MDNNADTWKKKGNEFYRHKRFEDALRCYLNAIQIDPVYADAWFNLGMTCRSLGYETEAVTCFEKAKKYKQAGSSADTYSGMLPQSYPEYRQSFRQGLPHTGTNLHTGVANPRKKKQSLKAWGTVIVLLLVMGIAVAAVLPIITGTGFNFLFSGSTGTDARVSAGQPGQAIVKSPGPGYSTVSTLNQEEGGIPRQYLALKTGAVSKSFPYVLRGQSGTVNLTMYQGVSGEIAKEDPYSYVGEKDRYQKFIYLPVQNPFLVSLVDAIREKTADPDDQVRIAVSLVQQIPYDQEMLDKGTLEIRYPYQTLLDNKGVCCEKSVLLAYILRELGYGVALFDYEEEKHTVVGIRTAPEYAYKNTGYAFIETTTPLIITDGNGEYPAFGRIRSLPEVLPVVDGKSFGSVSEEWNDTREWDRLNSLGPVLDRADYTKWQSLCRKYGIVPVTG
jgi:hypothetical protein